MDSRLRSLYIAGTLCVLLIATQVAKSNAFLPSHDFNPKSIADLKEAIVKGLGLQADDIKISGFDPRDALVGKSVAYEFHVEIDNKVMPFKLMEDVKRWEYLDLPVFQTEHPLKSVQENGLLERQRINDQIPVLAPFQLAGPMELWIQDADDMRISLPHDVDAGVLKKVILADGAVVTIKGARSVSLRHPIELPLPLNQTNNDFASGLLALAEHLQDAARFHNGPLPSLRIVGPTSLASSPSSSNRLKLKRLAPGLVELSSASTKMRTVEDADALSTVDFQEEAISVIDTDRLGSLWPVVSINGSSSNLLGFEALLSAVLGEKGHKDGSFKLLKADVSAQSYMKMSFEVVKKIREGDIVGYPEWRTKPQNVRMHFEVLGKIDGNKIVPEKVVQVNPFIEEDSVAPNVLMGNITMSKMPIVHAPPNPFTL